MGAELAYKPKEKMKILLNDQMIQQYLKEKKTQEIVYVVELEKDDSVKNKDVTYLIEKILDVLKEQKEIQAIKVFVSIE